MRDVDFWNRAACRDYDPELWFPVAEIGTAIGDRDRTIAKSVCFRCPIRDECLEWAMTTGQEAGVWGGLDEEQRRELRRADVLVDVR